ncbi:hypothetical protein QCA50_015249 [Cerrena zonata]|uniref:F-box domain-containing protein n=1 Tax=Cerrena zonata TaxID=2478898 RepID=A0AAW0FMX1_9APHY
MDSIPTSHDDFPPDVVEPNTSFSNLNEKEIHARIAEHQAIITKLHSKRVNRAEHRRAIARYRGQLNELVPQINKLLPPEILSEIFFQYREICVGSGYYGVLKYNSWLIVAHVCRYWRNIALSTPRLFTYIQIPTRVPARNSEFLRLSKNAPLHMIVDGSFDNPRRQAEYTLHLPHTRVLNFLERPQWNEWPVCPMLSLFTCRHQRTEDEEGVVWFDHSLDKIMPNLIDLQIDVSILGDYWPSSPLPHKLQTLTLIHESHHTSGTLNELMQTLANLPYLRDLTLVVQTNTYTGLQRTGAKLGHLDNLCLSGSSVFHFAFLHHVPSIGCADLRFSRETIGDDGVGNIDLASLPSILRTKWIPFQPPLSPVSTYSCRIFLRGFEQYRQLEGDTCHFNMDLFTKDVASNNSEPELNLSLDLWIVPLEDLRVILNSVTDILSPRLSLITECKVGWVGSCSDSRGQQGLVRTLLGSLSHVTSLHATISYPDSATYFGVECFNEFPIAITPGDGEDDDIPLPRLEELNIENWVQPELAITRICSTYHTFLTNLLVALRRRKARGRGLWSLMIKMEILEHSDRIIMHDTFKYFQQPFEEVVDGVFDWRY